MASEVKGRKGHPGYSQLLWRWGQQQQHKNSLWMRNETRKVSKSVDVLGCRVGTCCPSRSSLSMCRRVVFPALSSPRNTSFPVFLYKPFNTNTSELSLSTFRSQRWWLGDPKVIPQKEDFLRSFTIIITCVSFYSYVLFCVQYPTVAGRCWRSCKSSWI